MAELTKKLHFKKGATEHLAKAYSTTAEAGTEYITNKIDGVTAYIPIGATNDSRATMGRVKKPSGTEMAILTMGKPPYNKIEWRTAGSYIFTVPASITTLRVSLCGGGGGGSEAGRFSFTAYCGGFGGGCGASIINRILEVSPGETLSIVVGKGGEGGISSGTSGPNASTKSTATNGESSKIGNIECVGGTKGEFHEEINGAATKGSDSPFGEGGRAGTKYSVNGGNGGNGAGGGGGEVNSDPSPFRVGSGGDGGAGYVLIEYGGNI